MNSIRDDKAQVVRLLKGNSALRGVGITWRNGHRCVVINVAPGTNHEIRERVERNLPDVDVVIREIGEIETERSSFLATE
jgi:hypothetical protein